MIEPENEIEVVEEIQDVKERIRKAITFKGVARLAVGGSVYFAVNSALKTVVPVDSTFDKRRLQIASYAITGIISEKAKDYVSESIDDKVEFIRGVMAEVKKAENPDPTTP